MSYDCLTAEEQFRRRENPKEREQDEYEYIVACDIVRAAMELFDDPDLYTLRNAMQLASIIVKKEEGGDPDEAEDLGLDVWLSKLREDEEFHQNCEEWERSEQEAMERAGVPRRDAE